MEKSMITKRGMHVGIFALVALSCGWIGRWLDTYVGRDATGSLGQLLWIAAPILTMLLLRGLAGDGWEDAGLRLRLRGHGRYYAGSMLFFPVLTLLVVGLGICVGWLNWTGISLRTYAEACAFALIPSFFKNIAEEFAWRGYLAPSLHRIGVPRLWSHVTVGLVWGVWHIPYLFLFTMTSEGMLTFLPRMLLGVVAMAIVYGEIRLRTGSVWPAVIMHTVGNALINPLIAEEYLAIETKLQAVAMPSPDGWITMGLTGAVGVWLMLVRKKKKTA
ncbi:CPBP family glutamic-type intramembrane protease [Paenibacillus ferrarius]|uniref:CPBP family glutamic-type intramembrane protease n=1 Tax=Paenibacillus ferrarius TaxID=1469647 RepID=UPI003D28B411